LLVLDLSQLRNVTLDDEALMREVVSALIENTSRLINELNRAVDANDLKVCIRLAHNAQGACGNVGAVSLAALFQLLERQATGGEAASCRSSLLELSVELEKLRGEAKSL
jgi:HPt (histidine-containing phosphotransfer) domain-containing protein